MRPLPLHQGAHRWIGDLRVQLDACTVLCVKQSTARRAHRLLRCRSSARRTSTSGGTLFRKLVLAGVQL
jgi:hypothetical protein